MATWKDDYFAALEARDQTEKADVEIYEAYTRVADRTAGLSKEALTESPSDNDNVVSPMPTAASKRLPRLSSPPPTESLLQIRQDLSNAQQERGDLQTKLSAVTKELEALKAKSKVDTKRITQLSAGVTQMTVRLRDRDEELRGKAKLVEDVQDEMVTLNLQLNMAEEKTDKLKKENQELVDRWMARMGKEADAMNDKSQFR